MAESIGKDGREHNELCIVTASTPGLPSVPLWSCVQNECSNEMHSFPHSSKEHELHFYTPPVTAYSAAGPSTHVCPGVTRQEPARQQEAT